jgi:hypothetical protein
MFAPRIVDISRLPVRDCLLTVIILTTVFLVRVGAAEHQPDGANSGAENAPLASDDAAEANRKRVREGTNIDKTGYFRTTGDRVTFYADNGKMRYRGLENLMLERIARTIEDNPGQLEWKVTGIVTEYRGANFLLVTHAVLKTNEERFAPGQLTRLNDR